MHGAPVHPVQYLSIGFGLCLFYLLLLALSEHVGFDRASLVGASTDVGLLSWCWTWVVDGRRHGLLRAAALAGLYAYLYLLLRLEDYAVLAGAVGLFVMLAAVMFLTRRVDWFALRLRAERPPSSR